METGDRDRDRDRVRPGERERIYQDIPTPPKYHPTSNTSLLLDLENVGMNTKRRRRLRSVLNSVDPTPRKDVYNDEEEEGERERVERVAGDTSQGEWGTDDFDTETSAASGSASEVEDQVRQDTKEEAMDADTEQRVREKI